VTEVSFGWKVADWIEANCVIPDGWRAGEAYTLTAEMRDFLARFYAVDPRTGTFIHRRGGQLIRPQKWGKGPFSAAIICAEAMAPVVPVLEYGKFTLKRLAEAVDSGHGGVGGSDGERVQRVDSDDRARAVGA
jgi:hypothetical protein